MCVPEINRWCSHGSRNLILLSRDISITENGCVSLLCVYILHTNPILCVSLYDPFRVLFLCVWLYIPTPVSLWPISCFFCVCGFTFRPICVCLVHTVIWPVDVLHLSDCVLLSSLWNDSLRNTWPLEILYIEFFWYCSRVFFAFPLSPLWHVQFIYTCASPMHVRELHVHYSMHDVRSY